MPNYFETNTGPLLAAEFDYFRIPREQWGLLLMRLKQMGANAISVTVPWGFHEFQRGTVDLHGVTSARRDVVGLVNVCAAFDLVCLLKPGPYSDNGVLGHGLSAWLDTNNLEAALPPAVESWYRAVSKALSGQQWPNGPLIALQIESQPAGGSPPTLDKQLIEVKWRVWLRKRYEGIEALNAAHGATHRTVNDVIFPPTWANAATPLEKDAKAFLDETRGDKVAGYAQVLVDSGWQIPIYPINEADLPAMQTISLASAELPALEVGKKRSKKRLLVTLQQPIQVDPDPAEVGGGPVWAENAPMRPDGSVRPRFWTVRLALWGQLPKTALTGSSLSLAFKEGVLVTCGRDTVVKIETTATKLTAYRLKLNGELVTENNFKVRTGKFGGTYEVEDDAGQTDLVFGLSDASTPVSGFLLTCLTDHLTAQARALTRAAALAEQLGRMLTPTAESEPASTGRPARPPHAIEQARRGLSEADAALRKAMASIGALEGGLATIVGQARADMSQPATAPAALSPDLFEDAARDILIDAGIVCAGIAPSLTTAAATLQKTRDAALTVEQYRQSRAAALAAARAAYEELLSVLAHLRLEMAAERLPLVVWRIHDQVQAIVESLRWGVLN